MAASPTEPWRGRARADFPPGADARKVVSWSKLDSMAPQPRGRIEISAGSSELRDDFPALSDRRTPPGVQNLPLILKLCAPPLTVPTAVMVMERGLATRFE